MRSFVRASAPLLALTALAASCTLERYDVEFGDDGAADILCAEGALGCWGECIDPLRDSAHCGACDNVCGAHAACEDGACVCGTGFSSCPDGCVRLDNDRLNCGTCGTVCPEGETCRRSECGP